MIRRVVSLTLRGIGWALIFAAAIWLLPLWPLLTLLTRADEPGPPPPPDES